MSSRAYHRHIRTPVCVCRLNAAVCERNVVTLFINGDSSRVCAGAISLLLECMSGHRSIIMFFLPGRDNHVGSWHAVLVRFDPCWLERAANFARVGSLQRPAVEVGRPQRNWKQPGNRPSSSATHILSPYDMQLCSLSNLRECGCNRNVLRT